MNLGEIRDAVQNELQHVQTTAAWKNDVAKIANEKYSALMGMERWTFRTVDTHLRVLKDREDVTVIFSTGTGYPLAMRNASWTPGGLSNVLYEDYDALVLTEGEEENSLRRYGRIAGGETGFPRKWRQCFDRADGYYLQGFPDPDVTATATETLFLEEPAAATWRSATAVTDVILRHDRYRLPYDCAEIISIVSRDSNKRPLDLVNRTREKHLLLNSDQDAPGDPQAWVMDDAESAGPAPRKTLAGAASAGGSLTASTTYRYFYAFWWKGCYSGRSNIVTVTTTAGNKTIDFTNMEVEPTNRYGRTKHLFRDDGDGRFRWVKAVSYTASTTSDAGATDPDETWVWDDRMASPQMAIRLYPRPSSDQWLYVQYLRQPNQLQTDQDVPEMPHDFHPIIVHQVCAQIAARFKAPEVVGFHEAKANELIGRMRNQYVVRYTPAQMGQWRGPHRNRRWFPTNPASIS